MKSGYTNQLKQSMSVKKGVILAGGLGTRLHPLTKTTNKHLLPVYDKHMVMFPVETLQKAGINQILVISDSQHIGSFEKLLPGEYPGVVFSYATQDNPRGGIADALRLAKDFAAGESIAVILGDNIFEDNLDFTVVDGDAAKVFLKEVQDTKGLGIADIKDGVLTSILEKPDNPPTNFAVVGAYVYPPSVFDVISQIKPSGRGELEITDVNNYFAAQGKLAYQELKGFWEDAGTFEGIFRSAAWRKSMVK